MTPHSESIKFLAENCEAYQDVMQSVVDSLSAINCILESCVVRQADFMSSIVTQHLKNIQVTNIQLMRKVRGE